VTTSSFALLLLYPALCQLVLKKRKSSSNSTNSDGVPMKLMNNSNKDKSLSSTPFLSNCDSKLKSNGMKNNNINLNNAKMSFDSKLGSNLDKDNDQKTKSDFVDLEAGHHENGDCMVETLCASKNWVELYLIVINWKWFTVSQSARFLSLSVFLTFLHLVSW